MNGTKWENLQRGRQILSVCQIFMLPSPWRAQGHIHGFPLYFILTRTLLLDLSWVRMTDPAKRPIANAGPTQGLPPSIFNRPPHPEPLLERLLPPSLLPTLPSSSSPPFQSAPTPTLRPVSSSCLPLVAFQAGYMCTHSPPPTSKCCCSTRNCWMWTSGGGSWFPSRLL